MARTEGERQFLNAQSYARYTGRVTACVILGDRGINGEVPGVEKAPGLQLVDTAWVLGLERIVRPRVHFAVAVLVEHVIGGVVEHRIGSNVVAV